MTRSNGAEEWTVLAGIVSLHDNVLNKTPICFATGVKALPDLTLERCKGRVIHDCHAEVLCLRAFNLWVLKEVKKVRSGEVSEYIEMKNNEGKKRYGLKDGIDFAMYVSEAPCGDASLELLVDDNEETWERITKLDGDVLRGRESYTLTGRVRTKPGRRDSPTTLSKSCSDKLALKQITGLLNGLVSQFVDQEGFFLKWLIIPDDRVNDKALSRCFKQRLNGFKGSITTMNHFGTQNHHNWERSETKKTPSNLSVISIPDHNLTECITNGVKDGFYSKKTLLRPRGESSVSRVRFVDECRDMIDISERDTYIELKAQNEDHIKLKTLAYQALGGWCKTRIDDFVIV